MKSTLQSGRMALAAMALLFFAVGCSPSDTASDAPQDLGTGGADAADGSTLPPDLWTSDGALPDGGDSSDCPAALGKMGQELLKALSTCVRGQTALSYAAARDSMFLMYSDPANNNSVECFYTGRKAPQVTDRASANMNMFNTEHTWPQSLGAAGIAQSDMHHLFPTDNTANGKRANYPFGEVRTASWTGPDPDGHGPSKLGTRMDGKTVFEPRDPVKGNIARALLYFYTRYSPEPQSGYSIVNFTVEEETLHKWHMQDPPDAAERAHNEGVYKLQRNRNPYIDHPEYVERIGTFNVKP
ncbi:MAG TPA: endonuclease [Pseudomonadota bacterium]|nr:endonuclease [Pseudomonadota bacterium]